MRVYVATTNRGKLREMEPLFAGAPFTLATYDGYADPVEGDVSYADNAALKARALQRSCGAPGTPGNVLADDSGLEVYALDRRPGVLTAYYGGAELPWDRAARASCSPSWRRARVGRPIAGRASSARCTSSTPRGREFATLATVDGEIADREARRARVLVRSGFLVPPRGRTFAELSAEEKNRVSHRAIAGGRA